MIFRLDHVGVVAHSIEEASAVLVDTLGFEIDVNRTTLPEGNLYRAQNTRIFFIKVGVGETRLEILIPQDSVSGIAKYLAKRGPCLHHLGYAVDSVADHARSLRERGLSQIDLGPDAGAAFFYPKSVMGILTELVPDRTRERVHAPAG